jgi:hypothetical protein
MARLEVNDMPNAFPTDMSVHLTRLGYSPKA